MHSGISHTVIVQVQHRPDVFSRARRRFKIAAAPFEDIEQGNRQMANSTIASQPAAFGLSVLIDRAKSRLRAARARRAAFDQTFRELSFLTNRELSDIGMSRADVVSTAKRAAETV